MRTTSYIMLCITLSCILYFMQSVEGCTCFWGTHTQTEFCQSDYAIKAEVKSVELEFSDWGYPLYRHYTLNVLQVYKENYTIGAEVVVVTGGDDAMCGTYLSKNVTYFISGYEYNGKLHTSSCNWISRIESLTKSQLEGIEGRYEENCDCEISNFLYETNGKREYRFSNESIACNYNINYDDPLLADCYINNAFCGKDEQNQCAWQLDSDVGSCTTRDSSKN